MDSREQVTYISLLLGTGKRTLEEILGWHYDKPMRMTNSMESAMYTAQRESRALNDIPVVVFVMVDIKDVMPDMEQFTHPDDVVLRANGLNNEYEWFEYIQMDNIVVPDERDWRTSLKFGQSVCVNRVNPCMVFENSGVDAGVVMSATDINTVIHFATHPSVDHGGVDMFGYHM